MSLLCDINVKCHQVLDKNKLDANKQQNLHLIKSVLSVIESYFPRIIENFQSSRLF